MVTAGDQVNELHLIVAGQAVVERLASADVITNNLLLVVEGGSRGRAAVGSGSGSNGGVMADGGGSGAAADGGGGGVMVLGPGDCAGEMAFFTEMPCLEVRRALC